MAEIRRCADLYGILLDANARVLMLPDETGALTLPHFQEPENRSGWPMVGAVNRVMSVALAADITVLRQVYLHAADAQATHVEVIYMLENHSAIWMPPPQARWIERKELAALNLAYPEHQAAIEEAMAEAENGVIPDLRPPWARPRWFDAASEWMRQQLEARGYHLTAPIEQFKSWGISCLLRAETDRGAVYFKVASALPLFGNEPALLQALSERFPDYVPPPIAVDVERRWMLMGDFGSEFGDAPLERWEEAVRRFARLQIQSASMIDDLLSIGCLDRRLDVLAAQIDPLLSDESVLTELNADEIARVRSDAPRLKAMCGELAAHRVPFTLNHGDLHTGNITGESLLFFDWTDPVSPIHSSISRR
jgi:hypothetical protein